MALTKSEKRRILDMAFTGIFTKLNRDAIQAEVDAIEFETIDDVGDWLENKAATTSQNAHDAIAAKRREQGGG